jgi:PncC family amidohydrolase
MLSPDLIARAADLIARYREAGLMAATAESCTGGLIAGLLTEIPGSSDMLERGFVVYSNAAKQEVLGVPAETLVNHGAVSEQTAVAMAEGALRASRAEVAISVTGIAGPGGGSAEKPRSRAGSGSATWVAGKCGSLRSRLHSICSRGRLALNARLVHSKLIPPAAINQFGHETPQRSAYATSLTGLRARGPNFPCG